MRMNLLVDIGNTRLKWGISRNGEIEPGPARVHRGVEPEVLAETLWRNVDGPERVVVSNVGGQPLEEAIKAWVRRRWEIDAEFVAPEHCAFGVRNAYREPRKLGVDRWASLIALKAFHRLPACVVDCGTAITLDVMDREGVHRGGVIAPGLALMRNALYQGTSDIVQLTGESRTLLADNTGAAIQNGTRLAAAGLVERGMREFQEDFPEPLTLVFTGGDAAEVAALIADEAEIVEDLVLQGLAVIALSK